MMTPAAAAWRAHSPIGGESVPAKRHCMATKRWRPARRTVGRTAIQSELNLLLYICHRTGCNKPAAVRHCRRPSVTSTAPAPTLAALSIDAAVNAES